MLRNHQRSEESYEKDLKEQLLWEQDLGGYKSNSGSVYNMTKDDHHCLDGKVHE